MVKSFIRNVISINMYFTKDKLGVSIFPTSKDMGFQAADDVAERIKELLSRKETVNMLFAAAPSQIDFLAALVEDESIEWQRINAFHMDEYTGLKQDAPQRFGQFLKRYLFDIVPFRQVCLIDGEANPEEECKRYTSLLKEFPIDIVCLGIGENGHIAFNDPHVANFNDPDWVKVVSLDEVCRQQQVNDKCFSAIEEVPTHAFTLTIPAMLAAQYMYCIVPYRSKAQAVYNTLNGEVSEACPASVLRTKKSAALYLDAESASLL